MHNHSSMSTIAAQSSTNQGKGKICKGKVKVVKCEVKGKGQVNDKVGKVSGKGKGQVSDKVGEVSGKGKGKRKSSEVKGKDITSLPLYDDISVVREAFSDESLMKKLFQDWKRDYDRKYDTEEEELKRYECFKDTAHFISDNRYEGIDYTGLNVFADIPWDEFKVQKCGGSELLSDSETPTIFLTPA